MPISDRQKEWLVVAAIVTLNVVIVAYLSLVFLGAWQRLPKQDELTPQITRPIFGK